MVTHGTNRRIAVGQLVTPLHESTAWWGKSSSASQTCGLSSTNAATFCWFKSRAQVLDRIWHLVVDPFFTAKRNRVDCTPRSYIASMRLLSGSFLKCVPAPSPFFRFINAPVSRMFECLNNGCLLVISSLIILVTVCKLVTWSFFIIFPGCSDPGQQKHQ